LTDLAAKAFLAGSYRQTRREGVFLFIAVHESGLARIEGGLVSPKMLPTTQELGF
jgi:hypothetical protein